MERPILTISDGKIQGTTLESVLGVKYLAFKGIPYAQPPLGPLRFKRPQPPKKWHGILDVSKHASDQAMQNQTDENKPFEVIGSEDCLYLNVYTNKIGKKRPVMFYIHGGGFLEGTGNDYLYGEDYFVTADIVLISVNFRLGPMGFLNLGDNATPGNQGLRDIILALQWTQKNIEVFGGDPHNVTIFGNSSGSATCQLLTLLPTVKGLFHKAILQSGLIFFCKCAYNDKYSRNGFRIASLLGMDSTDPTEVAEFLRAAPAKKLISLEGHIYTAWESLIMGLHPYGPVYDGDHCDDPVVPLPLRELLRNDADIPIIIGHTTEEALLNLVGKFDNEKMYKLFDDNIEDIVKNYLMLKDPSIFPTIMEDIRRFYLKNQPINRDTVWNLIYMLTDLANINRNRKVIDMRNEHANAPTYVYKFSYLGDEPSFYTYDHGPQPLKGVAHADELSYMFNISYMKLDGKYNKCPPEGSKDRLVMERFIRLWSNFAATGNPTPVIDDKYITCQWKASTKEDLYYLEISDELALKRDKDTEDRKIYEKYRDYMFNI